MTRYPVEGYDLIGTEYIGGYSDITKEIHANIIAKKDSLKDVINKYTIDIELSRKNGTETRSPQVDLVMIVWSFMDEFMDLDFEASEKKESHSIGYYIKCYNLKEKGCGAISAHEWCNIKPELKIAFNNLIYPN